MSTKLSKSMLKSLIKECLIEVLSEGLSSSKNSITERIESYAVSKNTNFEGVGQQKNKKTTAVKNKNFDKNTKSAVNTITSDPIMSEIFKDTAKITLQEQLNAEGKISSLNAGDNASKAVGSVDDISDIFGESSSKWANLAFDNK